MITIKKKLTITIILLGVILWVGGYLVFSNLLDNTNNINEGDKTVLLSSDYPITSELSEMIDEADIVVIGEYKNFDSKWNMARNPENIMEEDPDNYTEGHLYNFEISKKIKGETESNQIKVNHRYSEIILLEESNEVINDEGIIVREATKVITKEIENIDPLYIEPTIGQKYMLFLSEDEVFGSYYGAIEPFAIVFDENDVAELKTNLVSIDEESLSQEVEVGESNFTVINEIYESVDDTISGESLEEITEIVEEVGNESN